MATPKVVRGNSTTLHIQVAVQHKTHYSCYHTLTTRYVQSNPIFLLWLGCRMPIPDPICQSCYISINIFNGITLHCNHSVLWVTFFSLLKQNLKNFTFYIVGKLWFIVPSVTQMEKVSFGWNPLQNSKINLQQQQVLPYLLLKRSYNTVLSVWSTTTQSNHRSGKKSQPW